MTTRKVCRKKCVCFIVRGSDHDRVYLYVPYNETHGMLYRTPRDGTGEWVVHATMFSLRTIDEYIKHGNWVKYDGATPPWPI